MTSGPTKRSIASPASAPPNMCPQNYFFRAYELLRPGGQFFHHAIVRSLSVAERPGRSFMERYVFPDHFLPTIGHTVTSAEAGRLNIYQTLLSKPDRGRSGLPLTRPDWYRSCRNDRR